jgi:MazG family protein
VAGAGGTHVSVWSSSRRLLVKGRRPVEEEEFSEGESGIPDGVGNKFERLAAVMARLRSPGGCPWDNEQTPATLAKHILEEAYETVDAIDSADWEHLSEELGDLLLQIVFQARIAEEHGRFDLADVVDGITEKLERRHPHIFGTEEVETSEQVIANWERIKREQEGKEVGVRMPAGLPAILASRKVQGQAARDGFDWEDARGVLDKLDEEVEELKAALAGPVEEVEQELGDLLFTAVNLSRHVGVDPEKALRRTALEFVRRYALMEAEAGRRGVRLETMSIEEKEELWQAAKSDEGE